MPQDHTSDEPCPLHRSKLRRISCMSFLFLAMFVGSVILYLLPWRIICNLGVPFVPVRARFSFRLFPEDLERYQDLRYEEIFSSFPFYLIHDPSRTIIWQVRTTCRILLRSILIPAILPAGHYGWSRRTRSNSRCRKASRTSARKRSGNVRN